MKRSVLVITLMMISAAGFSQSTLKGPKAKNASAAELAANASPLKFYSVPLDVKGPEAKNLSVWERPETRTKIVFVRRDLDLLKGPKAKNKKVWED
ncbi:hypothetical protein [Algoriphagus antarcticus]|uniref:Uncharacterized protein n=1 Tax=Algoriphagus antarcticus TaxID=238540 RepID=A0A3E0DWU4_9BACT|nr:hypothetical protein [Algoriphagus antarcticus]REG90524.1 hypothetical protein C8N25_10622 [Algoriphagus antarcticus]